MNPLDFIDPCLLKDEPEDPRYVDSPFRKLKKLHAKQKGSRYEKISEQVLVGLGKTVLPPTNTDHDRIVDNVKVEIKGSTLNKNSDNFSFLQIRPDQDYDVMYFCMFYPYKFVIMSMTKDIIIQNIENGNFSKQHGGKKAESRTFCYYGNKITLKEIGAVQII